MSQSPLDRILSCEDDEFVFRVDTDIRNYIKNCKPDSILLFPPVNSYRRFLIHKVCELVTSSQTNELTTFSIGLNECRRTVVCHRYQLLAETEHDHLKRIQDSDFSWNYLERNSVPINPQSKVLNIPMGVESHHLNKTDLSKKFEIRKNSGDSSPEEIITKSTKKKLATRTRRPDRAFYVPRAKRSQTTPPSSNNSSSSSTSQTEKKSGKKNLNSKSKSIEHDSSEENFGEPISPEFSSALKCHKVFADCENNPESDEVNNLKNSIEFGISMTDNREPNQMIKEVSSQKINCNDKTSASISDKAIINEASNGDGNKNCDQNQKAVNQDEDDWDTLYDDSGECLDPKMIEELSIAVGKVKIEKPKQDYSAYNANMDLLKDEEFPHVLEISNFPVDFKTEDLMMIFSQYKESGFDLKWVDDTHCLVIFSNARIAAEALTMCHPVVKLSPMKNATQDSRTRAKKCSNSLLPYKQRPETCAALAKRLVSGHLGIRNKTTAEDREKERKILREAKERKLLAAKQREESWNS